MTSRDVDYAEYCRQLESYLCQKNGGHLIRIVGPAFEQVRAWSDLGVPFAVACRGIDRYCERQQAVPGRRRRPVRIEFCEADILAVFDDWRRAVGVVVETGAGTAPAAPKPPALAAHLERTVARLIGRRQPGSPELEARIAAILPELDRLAAESRTARGEARTAILDRLTRLDDELMALARAGIDPATDASFRREAEQELSGIGGRMPPAARAQATDAIVQRLVREALTLPTIRYG
jgi:hypothetical protein